MVAKISRQKMIHSSKLIVITGPPGAGKTTASLNLRIRLHKSHPNKVRYVSGDSFGQIFFPWLATHRELDQKYVCIRTILNQIFELDSGIVVVLDDLIRRQTDLQSIETLCRENNIDIYIYKLQVSLATAIKRNDSKEGWYKMQYQRLEESFILSNKISFTKAELIDGENNSDYVVKKIIESFETISNQKKY